MPLPWECLREYVYYARSHKILMELKYSCHLLNTKLKRQEKKKPWEEEEKDLPRNLVKV